LLANNAANSNVTVVPTLGRTFRPVRENNSVAEEKSADFTPIFLLKCSPIFIKLYQKCNLTKGVKLFFSPAEFYGHSGRIILKRRGNTGKRENKCHQIFLQAYF
jgi:hypothetical protein